MNKNMKSLTSSQMEKVSAKGAALPMDPSYRSKSNCSIKAVQLIQSHSVSGMTLQEIQEEIFGHAVAYYDFATLSAVLVSSALGAITGLAIANWLRDHCETINIEDGGETRFGYKEAFRIIWQTWPDSF